MPVAAEYLAYVLDQLSVLGGVTSRRMFGGVGLYRGEYFFGLISDDVLYFKVDDTNRADYEREGMKSFRPFRDRPHYEMGHYEVPASALEDPETLADWARKSLAVAARGDMRPVRRKL